MTLPSSSAELALVVIDDATSCLDFPLPRQFVCHQCYWYLEDPRRKKKRAPCAQPWKRRPVKNIICYKDPLEWLNDQRLTAVNAMMRSRRQEAAEAAHVVVPSSTSLPTERVASNGLDEPAFRVLSGLQAGEVVVTISANDNDFRLKKVAKRMSSSAPTGSELNYEGAPNPLPSSSPNASAEVSDLVVEAAEADAAVEAAQGEKVRDEPGEENEKGVTTIGCPSDGTTSEASQSSMPAPPSSSLSLHDCSTSATTTQRLSVASHLRLEVSTSTQILGVPACLPKMSHTSQTFRPAESLPLKKRKVWVAPERTPLSPSHDPAGLSKPPTLCHSNGCSTIAPPSFVATSAFDPIFHAEQRRTATKAMNPQQQSDPSSHLSLLSRCEQSHDLQSASHRGDPARPETRPSASLVHLTDAPPAPSHQRLDINTNGQSTAYLDVSTVTCSERVATEGALFRHAMDGSATALNCHLSRSLPPLEDPTARSTGSAHLELELSSSKRRDDGNSGALARRDQLPSGSPIVTRGSTTPCLLPANPCHDQCAKGDSASCSRPGTATWEQADLTQRQMELQDEEEDEYGASLPESVCTNHSERLSPFSPLRRNRARDGPNHPLATSSHSTTTKVFPIDMLAKNNLTDSRHASPPSSSSGGGAHSPLERVLQDNTKCYEVPAPTFPGTANPTASTVPSSVAGSGHEAREPPSPDSSTGDPLRTWRGYLKGWVKW
jgi:hypothetical protein